MDNLGQGEDNDDEYDQDDNYVNHDNYLFDNDDNYARGLPGDKDDKTTVMMVMKRVVEEIIKLTVMVIITKITKFSGYQRVGCEQEEASTGGITHTILAQFETFDHSFNVIAW